MNLNSSNRNKIILLVILAITLIFTNLNLNTNNASNFDVRENFPFKLAEWKGEEIKLENNAVYKVMDPEDLVFRAYTKNADIIPVNLSIILADNKRKVHDPLFCFKLQGFEFLEMKDMVLEPGLTVSHLSAVRADKKYSFIFWYTDLGKNYSSRQDFWKNIILNKITGKPIKTYGIVILNTEKSYEKELFEFAKKTNDFLFNKLAEVEGIK
ncbi:MAG TPA: exosortase-associated EpsI family protein [Candidatus Gastranaerophilales bacterium]|nr:exosortase-associated EpsI family protein [Candidatus Gastranaerophilales bacterium]